MKTYSANVLMIYKKKILLLLRDNKPDITDPNKWCLPGGGLEENETFEQALVREVKEETNIDIKNYKLIGILKIKDHKGAVYFSYLTDKEAKQAKLGSEGQKLKFFSCRKIKDLESSTTLKSAFDLHSKYITECIEKEIFPNPKVLKLK